MEMNIAQLNRNLPSGLVTTVHWTASKTDGDFTGYSYGSIGLAAKDSADPTFIAYEDLTKDQVIEWVKEAMGAEQVAALEAAIDGQIEAQKNPVTAAGVPW